VRAKVIAEGANLGVTQAGRIEFARKGGRINTDAIDNSAGVDSSDHEVNIKILLAEAINEGSLKVEDRNPLLASMTEDVGLHVLQNNYDQTGALSIMQANAAADLDSHERFIETLESQGKLDRVVEGLPSPEKFRELREQSLGLTRPELAVVMAYAKLDLFALLVGSEAPDDPAFEDLLTSYFPDELEKYGKAQQRHRLRREIIATRLSNRIVNLVGPTYAAQKRDVEGVDSGALAEAFWAAYSVFHFDDLFDRINALDGKAPAAAQIVMTLETAANLRILTNAFLTEPTMKQAASPGPMIARYREGIAKMRDILPKALGAVVTSRVEARAERYRNAGAPADIAHDVAQVRALASARETIDTAAETKWPLEAVAYVQHQVGSQLGLDRMRAAARDLEPRDHWDRLALQRVADDLPRQQSQLVIAAIRAAQGAKVDARKLDRAAAQELVESWIAPHRDLADRLIRPMASFDRQGAWSLARLVLLGDAVREFVYACRAGAVGSKP
jgi:glutamate dehydrogenase